MIRRKRRPRIDSEKRQAVSEFFKLHSAALAYVRRMGAAVAAEVGR